MRKYLLGAATLIILGVSCKKDKDLQSATIVDTGDVTVDGCGYLIRLNDGKEEKPIDLPSAYEHNNLKVKIRFHSSGILDTCGSTPPRRFFELVYIDDIKMDLD